MRRLMIPVATAGLLILGAAGPADAVWPCEQRKVEHLSLGVMWPYAIVKGASDLSPTLDEVAVRLALRRVSLDEARFIVAGAAAHPDFGLEEYGRLFEATFARIDAERTRIVEGIGRYAANQARLASEVEALEAEMATLEAASTPDFDRMDEVEAEVDWRVRVFRDRSRALTYVCESPVLLEQRAYAIAQMLLEAAEGRGE